MRELFQRHSFQEIANAYQQRYDESIRPETLEDIARIVLHPNAIYLGETQHGVPWSRDTWLMWIRNRRDDLARFDWERTARPFLTKPPSLLPRDEETWRKYMAAYAAELLTFEDTFVWFPELENQQDTHWLGHDPATTEMIHFKESQLNARLPNDVKTFYQVTNGWGPLSLFTHGIVPIDRIAPLKEADPGLYGAIAEPPAGPPDRETPRETGQQKADHDQVVRVLRSIVFSEYGGETTILWDLQSEAYEKAWGTWDPDRPGMNWSSGTFTELIHEIRSRFNSLRDSD